MSIFIKNLIKKAKLYQNVYLEMMKSNILKMNLCGTEEEMRDVAARICRNYLHGAWKTVDPKHLEFRRISGGLSNFLYYVALPDDISKLHTLTHDRSSSEDEDKEAQAITRNFRTHSSFNMEEPKKVLLRIYGQVHGERAMDAIVTESVIFTLLSERRLGPRLHGVFSGGRIEEYIPARALHVRELAEPAMSMKIAEKMAAIHSMDVPLSKEPNWIWKTMVKWMKTAREERFIDKNLDPKNKEEERIIEYLRTIEFDKEIEWLKKFILAVESPVVFCHNDMQEGNILLIEDSVSSGTEDDIHGEYSSQIDHASQLAIDRDDSKSVTYDDANTTDSLLSHLSDSGEPKLAIIDFEYCAYNHRGFDIANHFQEWMYDYTNPEHPFYFESPDHFPTLEQKEIFIKEYLKHYYSLTYEEKERPVTIDDVNQLLNEVEAFALASHLFWTLWSIVNASKSTIPFGYWEYAVSRLEVYQRLKQEVIKKDSFGLPQKRKICEVDI